MKEIEKKILEENRKLHDFGANNYDNYPKHLIKSHRNSFSEDAKEIKKILTDVKEPLVLDAGCGSGEMALCFALEGLKIQILDISQEMINTTKIKLRYHKLKEDKAIVSDVEAFLTKRNEKYDVIAFVGVLHHLYDYIKILKLASKSLSSRGLLYIAHDPLKFEKRDKKMAEKIIDSLENAVLYVYKIATNPIHALRFIKEVTLKKKINVGVAEYHATKGGIEEDRILDFLKKNGFKIMMHKKNYERAFKIFEIIDRMNKKPEYNSRIIAQLH